jgi:palmitoyl transferase
MKARRVLALVVGVFSIAGPAQADWWQDTKDMLAYKCERSKDAFFDGRNDYYASGLTRHAPWAYSSERRHDELNEAAWGGGFGRSVVDANGNTHSLYAMVFRDSHYKPQYTAGYFWMTYWPLAGRLQGGLGYSAFLFSRDDIGNRYPLPAVLPAASVRYREVELIGTFIPGFTQGGNVGYFFARFGF